MSGRDWHRWKTGYLLGIPGRREKGWILIVGGHAAILIRGGFRYRGGICVWEGYQQVMGMEDNESYVLGIGINEEATATRTCPAPVLDLVGDGRVLVRRSATVAGTGSVWERGGLCERKKRASAELVLR